MLTERRRKRRGEDLEEEENVTTMHSAPTPKPVPKEMAITGFKKTMATTPVRSAAAFVLLRILFLTRLGTRLASRPPVPVITSCRRKSFVLVKVDTAKLTKKEKKTGEPMRRY